MQTEECTDLQQTVTGMNMFLHQWSLEVNLRAEVLSIRGVISEEAVMPEKKHRSEKKKSKTVELHLNYQ